MRRHSPGQNALVTRFRNRFERLTRALHLSNQEKLYLHLDISSSHNGYKREIHHDNPNRLVAFVIYFSDAAESEGQGGEFVIHRHRTKKRYAEYERQPDPADTTVHETLTPKRGLGVVFLSTRNSYHSVPILAGATKSRKFIYGGLSVASPRKLWK